MKFFIDNAKQYRDLFPDSFEIPSNSRKRNLVTGDFVKLSFRFGTKDRPFNVNGLDGERMWVEIIDADYPRFTGVLDSVPTSMGDLIEPINFRESDVLEIYGQAEQEIDYEKMIAKINAKKESA